MLIAASFIAQLHLTDISAFAPQNQIEVIICEPPARRFALILSDLLFSQHENILLQLQKSHFWGIFRIGNSPTGTIPTGNYIHVTPDPQAR